VKTVNGREVPQKKPLALITGGAKRIGKEIVFHLARQGYSIALHYFQSSKEAKAVSAETKTYGVECLLLKADLQSESQIESIFNSIDFDQYDLKVIVNSAAVIPRSDLMNMNSSDWDQLINTNLKAVWLCCRNGAKKMQNGGAIINISDSGASKNWTGYGGYVISKAGVEVLTRVLARELAPNIRVNAIAPGLLLRNEMVNADQWNHLVEKVPMKRSGDLPGLLQTLDLLIQNEFITGETIHFDGGSLLG
jgi:pteridine reductase